MTWYAWKLWRVAYDANMNPETRMMVDKDGFWIRVCPGFFWLRTRTPL